MWRSQSSHARTFAASVMCALRSTTLMEISQLFGKLWETAHWVRWRRLSNIWPPWRRSNCLSSMRKALFSLSLLINQEQFLKCVLIAWWKEHKEGCRYVHALTEARSNYLLGSRLLACMRCITRAIIAGSIQMMLYRRDTQSGPCTISSMHVIQRL